MANHYIRAGATGSADGSDWTNAWTAVPATLIRGDTYFIADGSYGEVTFDDAVSGTTYIYIKKATAAAHGTETGWEAIFGDGQALWTTVWFATSYWDFDGVVGGGPGSWKSGHGFRFYRAADYAKPGFVSIAAFAVPVTHVNIRHIEGESTPFVYEGVDTIPSVSLLSVNTVNQPPATDILLEYSYCHYVPGGLAKLYGCRDFTIQYCYLWDTWAHSSGISLRDVSGLDVRYNMFEDVIGTNLISMYRVGVSPNYVYDHYIRVYGNAWFETATPPQGAWFEGCTGGFASNGNQAGPSNCKAYNNTSFRLKYGLATQHSGWGSFTAGGPPGDFSNFSYDNLYYDCSSSMIMGCTVDYDVRWKTAYGYTALVGPNDIVIPDATAYDPFVNSTSYPPDLRLAAATGPGRTITDVDGTYGVDAYGVTRAVDGAWDCGAYEFNSGATPPNLKLVMVLR